MANFLARAGRFLRSPMFPIFMIVFVDVLGLGITLPVMPLYATTEFSASALQVTLLSSVYFAAQFLAAPRLGRLSDRVGRRPVLIISQIGTFTALLLSGLAGSLPWLYLARAIDGLTGGNISVAQAYLSDITDENNRARGIGLVNAAFSSGFIFGPAFGSLAAAHIGPRAPFFIGSVVSVLTVLLSFFLLPESLPPERRQQSAARRVGAANRSALLRQAGVARIMAIGFLGQFAFFHFQTIYVLWADQVLFPGRDTQFVQQAIGGILTFVGLCGVFTQFVLVGPLVRRYGEKAMVTGGLAGQSLAWVAMVLLPYVAPVVIAVPFMAVGRGVAIPALLALLTYAALPDQRGHAIGTLESIQGLGRVLGPVSAGLLFEHVHPSAPLGVAAIVGVAAMLVALSLWRAGVS